MPTYPKGFRRSIQQSIATAVAAAVGAAAKQTAAWNGTRDGMSGTVYVDIVGQDSVVKGTITHLNNPAGSWATVSASGLTFNEATSTSSVSTAWTPPSTAPYGLLRFRDSAGVAFELTVGSRAAPTDSTGPQYRMDPVKPGVRVRLKNMVLGASQLAPAPAPAPGPGPAPAPSPGPAPAPAPAPAEGDAQITSFQVRNSGAGSVTNPVIEYTQLLKRGDVPASARLEVRSADGSQVITTQQDGDSQWNDGTLRAAIITIRPGETYTGEQTKTYQLWRVGGAPNRTAGVTIAQIVAGSDFKVRCTGGDFGADLYEASVNDILQNGPELSPTGNWGANPLRGWERIRSGPNVTKWRAWSYIRRTSDSAYHKWIKATFWVSAYSPTSFKIAVLMSYGNTVNPATGATAGPTSPLVQRFECELFNGGTRIRAYGGANDSRTRSIASSAVSGNSINLGAGFTRAQAVRFSGASLPAGITAGQTYWIGRAQGSTSTSYTLHNARGDVFEGVRNAVTLTSAGSGSFTVTPMMTLAIRQSFYMFGEDGLPDFVGFTQPEMLVAPNAQYLTRQTRLVPPYDLTLTAPGAAGSYSYEPNAPSDLVRSDIDGTGDGAGDERIGYLSHTETVALIYKSLDAPWRRRLRHTALWWSDALVTLDDEATGLLPNFSKNSYVRLGTAKPYYRWGFNDQSGVNPKHPDSGQYVDYVGYNWGVNGSHLPNHWFGAYVLSGEEHFRETGMRIWNMLYACTSKGQTFKGSQYEGVFNAHGEEQVRGMGWAYRTMCLAQMTLPQTDPHKQYIADAATLSLDFYVAQANGREAIFSQLGNPFYYHNGYWAIGFMGLFLGTSIAMLKWTGEYAATVDPAWSLLRKWMLDQMDADLGGCLDRADAYHPHMRKDASGNPVNFGGTLAATWQEVWDLTEVANGRTAPYACPANNSFRSAQFSTSYGTIYRGMVGIVNMMGEAQGGKLYDRVVAATPGVVPDYRYAFAKA